MTKKNMGRIFHLFDVYRSTKSYDSKWLARMSRMLIGGRR